MGKHRTRLEILINILSVISDKGAKKTQIMYKAYLNYIVLTRYLSDILESGLVTCKDGNFYRLTKKGKQFLTKFLTYRKQLDILEKTVNHVENQRLSLEKMCPIAQRTNEKE